MINTMYNETNVKKSLVEVEKILEKLKEEEYKKIPKDIKVYIQENKDNDYIWEFDEEKSLEEQKLNECTLPMLAYINTEFLLNDEQKEYMNRVYKKNDKKIEEQLQEKYNSDDIFKNKIQEIKKVKNGEKIVLMTEYKEGLFTKIINKIKRIFSIGT